MPFVQYNRREPSELKQIVLKTISSLKYRYGDISKSKVVWQKREKETLDKVGRVALLVINFIIKTGIIVGTIFVQSSHFHKARSFIFGCVT